MNRRTLLLASAAFALPTLGATAETRVEHDVVYGEPEGHKLLMDIYRPDAPGPHPAVILVHGGGWLGGSKAGHEGTGRMLARNGYVACAINYRLAPAFPDPAAFDDCQRAVRWIRAHAEQYGVHRKRVGALGDSAGGHLVALIGVRGTRDNSDPALARFSSRPQAVVSLYGAHELVRMWDIEMAHRPLTAWLGGAPQGREKRYAEASPASMVTRKAPPFLILHGDKDAVNPEEQSHLLHDALRRHGVDSTLLILEGAGHGWAPESPHGRQAEAAVLQFFGKHLRVK
ncbi:MAG TPA: alpha/beta hydrolase [Armatimonadota bacterium]|nr:alpha/beta hydrolase [Armatimonadota bacterium]